MQKATPYPTPSCTLWYVPQKTMLAPPAPHTGVPAEMSVEVGATTAAEPPPARSISSST